MLVYVLNQYGKPLMPCKPARAKHLLRECKAKVVKRIPFTIQLKYGSSGYKQDLNLGIDPGSKELGTAVRVNRTKKIVYTSKVKLRTDIKSKMDRRRSYRQTRRNRKTCYRQPRFLNRTRKEGWLPPSVQSKIDSTKKEIKFVFSILPITRVIFEYAKFDIHKLTNKFIKGFWYQLGDKYGYESTKSYVLARDKYKCQACKGRSKDKRLEVHHIKYRRDGGTNKPTNLLTLCHTCHKLIHSNQLELNKNQLKACVNTVDATQISIISKRIWEFLQRGIKIKRFSLVKTFGYTTKVKRRLLKIRKDHHIDALACTYPKRTCYRKGLRKPCVKSNFYSKICVSKGDYQQTKGIRSQQKIPTGKIQGFRKFDLVKYIGKIYAIKGRMSSGYAILMDKEEKKVELKPIPKFSKLKRISCRNTWIIFPKIIKENL